jgi:hexosaminidase
MRIISGLLLICFAILVPCMSQTRDSSSSHQLQLMPWPLNVKIAAAGQLAITPTFSVGTKNPGDARLETAVAIFLNDLRRHTGMLPLNFSETVPAKAQLVISRQFPTRQVQEVGEDESYNLEVTSSAATLNAPTALGVMRGLQTFLQLAQITPQGFVVPAVSIQDKPRFPWRGLLIDTGRHYLPVDVIKRNLDGMAAVKLNVLHWHISDYQGFRIESKKFPKLHQMGSDGLYYTQDELHDIIEYAHDRGIRILPEFDMPGHSTSWFVGYPELASGPGPYSIERNWGVLDPAMDPTRESTYQFLDEFIGEMAALFPDQFFHIGGDEVNGKEWDKSPKIQDFMQSHKLKDNADLQAYFNEHLQKILAKHGKTMMGWDEILRPDLPKSIVIQSWRGPESLAAAAKQGYRSVLSSGYYVDLMSPASAHYAIDPFSGAAANLSDDEKQRVLGGEACMWGEYVSGENIDGRIWPRAAAIAERLWSPQNVTNTDSMYSRLDEVNLWLDAYGLTHNTSIDMMLKRMAGSDDISALKTLASVVEPVKGYSRESLGTSPPNALMPLNRLIDAVHPESQEARQFSVLVNQLISGRLTPAVEVQIRSMLEKWKSNAQNLRPLAETSSMVKEVVPLSQDLSTLGAAGLEALGYLDHGEKAPADWKNQRLAQVQAAFQPRAEVLMMVAPPIQRLIQASAGETPTDLAIQKNAQ